ncbi:LysR family transcriptional regulator [Poseidonocella sp. HB161398]|uniref:LysR family transcriptional regulator n=1 Tax=Poseidonocella sp. HB161398 TaxID=2320855 RepID=UPI001107F378|nr:LysR family transcriptional regulator [Poseidonocella sp. HB161398]
MVQPEIGRDDLALQLQNMRVFLAVSEAGSIAQAAQALFKAPSAVSRSVVELERSLGVKVFERNARGIIQNDYGALLARRAGRIEAELGEAAADLARIRSRSSALSPRSILQLLFNGRKLQLVSVLAETRKISTAAARLGISQSGASMALSRLESALGATLFERGMQGVVATEAAARLAIRARRVFAELRHLAADISALAGSPSGTVVIGMLPLGRTYVFPMAIAEAISGHPGIHVRTIDSPFAELMAGLRCGDIDMIAGVPRAEEDRTGIVIEPLFSDALTVVARQGHPLAGRRLELDEMMASAWVLPWQNSPSRTMFDNAFRQAGLPPPQPCVESADLAVIRQLLTASNALALVSARQMQFELESGLIDELDCGLPEMSRDVGLITREGAMLPPVAQILTEAIRRQAILASAGD